MTGRSRRSTSTMASTDRTQEPRLPCQNWSLRISVVIQAIKDLVQGNQKRRTEVLAWLATPEDFKAIVGPLGLDPDNLRRRLAGLMLHSPALRVHYATKMIEELKKMEPVVASTSQHSSLPQGTE